jgi:hypothetical protein
MRILGLLKADESSERGDMPSPELISRMGEFMQEVSKAGILLGTDGLKPSAYGKRVSLSDGRISVTDGPFTESKELVASYALFDVKTMEEAVEWCTRFLKVLGEGQCELRPIWEASDFPADVFPPEEQAKEEAWRAEMEKNAPRQP